MTPEMTPEQQQIAIAEVCGWTQCEYVESLKLAKGIPPLNNSIKYGTYENGMAQLPNYLGDLNACHEMEKVLDYEQCEAFSNTVADIVHSVNREKDYAFPWAFARIHSTAAQRCEAFLRTLGLWQKP